MQQVHYECGNCGTELSYQVTKHKGCENCGFLPAHSAD
jgi:DNA-directed RNA polymerase subunit RPC12/RpoP